MAIVSTVELPVEGKDPREAVRQWLKFLKSQTAGFNSLQIDAGLTSMANKDVLVRLAESLPGTALGFRSLSSSDRAKTASEFLDDFSPSFWSYQGTLTQHLPPLKALALIEELISCPPQAIRSTSFMLNSNGFQWKSAPSDSCGYLNLFDLKAFNRKQRFSLTAGLNCSGNVPKSPETLANFQQVFDSTGIPFHKGEICKVADEGQQDNKARANTILVGQICFDEAIEAAAEALNLQANSQWTKTALSSKQAFDLRIEQWGAGNSERVDLASVAKRIIKSDLPELTFETSDVENIRFKKSLTSGLELTVVFSRSLPRLGKAFTIGIGVQQTDSSMTGIRFETNLFRLEKTREERSWIYTTRDEAAASVRIAAEAVKNLLPVFESAFRSYFNPWPTGYPTQIQRHGSITAKQAVELALPLVRHQLPDSKLIRLTNSTRSLAVRDIEGPELDMDGRLKENAMWWLHFYSEAKDKSVEVHVPAVGCIRILDHGDQYKNVNSRRILAPIDGVWIDSNEAFGIAEKNGGQERRTSGKMFGVSAGLHAWEYHCPIWKLTYLITDERGRNDLTVVIEAGSGVLIPQPPR
jgi:hypothetical protein